MGEFFFSLVNAFEQYARFVYEPKLRHTTRPLMLACELNKAFCHLKLKQWREAIKVLVASLFFCSLLTFRFPVMRRRPEDGRARTQGLFSQGSGLSHAGTGSFGECEYVFALFNCAQDMEAKKNIMQAKRLCADDPGIDREITLIEWQWEQRRKREKKIFENLFDESKLAEMSESAESALVQPRPLPFKEARTRFCERVCADDIFFSLSGSAASRQD